MTRGVRHPRAVGAIRALLAIGLAVFLGVVGLSVVGMLFVFVTVGSLAAIAGVGVDALALAGVATVAIVLAGIVATGAVVAFRRAERRVIAADSRPDPVETLTERYVAADLDEREFERRLGHVLADERSDAEYEYE